MKIFISYRRDDSIVHAKLVHNELAARFGADQVFMDIDDIGYGDDFVQAIDTQLEAAEVVVVVIGPRWAEMIEARLRGDDWVRHEVARALQMRTRSGNDKPGQPRVLPLLVGGSVPPAMGLPEDIAGLQRLSMLKFDERALQASVNTLIEAIQQQTFEEVARDLRGELTGRRRAQIAGVLIGLCMFLAGWIALFDFFGLDTRLATATMALAGWGHPSASAPWSGRVVLVGIDEGSERAIGRKFDSSWRAEHARLIESAASAGATTVAFDLVLDSAGPESADRQLEQALAATHSSMPVIFGVQQMDGLSPGLLPRFAVHGRWGIACAGLKLAQARSMPLAVQRELDANSVSTLARRDRFLVTPSLALAAFSGGGRVEPLDDAGPSLQVMLTREQRSQLLTYFGTETVKSLQPGCEAMAPGDRVAYQLFDPLALPALRDPPQRVAYERVLQGDAATLALLKDRIVLVGKQIAHDDVLSLGPGGERWGVELIAQQIDALSRAAGIRPLGGLAQWMLTSALGLAGAFVAFRLRRRPAHWRAAACVAMALLFVGSIVGWYRMQQQLIGMTYGLGALVLGTWVASRLSRRKST